jgi:hypothetical protein
VGATVILPVFASILPMFSRPNTVKYTLFCGSEMTS